MVEYGNGDEEFRYMPSNYQSNWRLTESWQEYLTRTGKEEKDMDESKKLDRVEFKRLYNNLNSGDTLQNFKECYKDEERFTLVGGVFLISSNSKAVLKVTSFLQSSTYLYQLFYLNEGYLEAIIKELHNHGISIDRSFRRDENLKDMLTPMYELDLGFFQKMVMKQLVENIHKKIQKELVLEKIEEKERAKKEYFESLQSFEDQIFSKPEKSEGHLSIVTENKLDGALSKE